jgi:hypothetical protein
MTGLPLLKKVLLVMWKKILSMAGALVVIGAIFTGGWILDDRYAKADDAKQNRSDIKINGLKDNIRWYQDQMSYIMTRCNVRNPNQLPQGDYQTYQNYHNQKVAFDKELQIQMQKRKQ